MGSPVPSPPMATITSASPGCEAKRCESPPSQVTCTSTRCPNSLPLPNRPRRRSRSRPRPRLLLASPLMNRLSKLLPLAVNIASPLLIYTYAAPHFGERNALILSSIPPILWSAIEIARFRRLDAVSLLAIIGIFLSLAAMAFGGNPRLLLLRESLVTGIIGFLFLGSLLLPRPLMFYLARSTTAKGSGEEMVRLD